MRMSLTAYCLVAAGIMSPLCWAKSGISPQSFTAELTRLISEFQEQLDGETDARKIYRAKRMIRLLKRVRSPTTIDAAGRVDCNQGNEVFLAPITKDVSDDLIVNCPTIIFPAGTRWTVQNGPVVFFNAQQIQVHGEGNIDGHGIDGPTGP